MSDSINTAILTQENILAQEKNLLQAIFSDLGPLFKLAFATTSPGQHDFTFGLGNNETSVSVHASGAPNTGASFVTAAQLFSFPDTTHSGFSAVIAGPPSDAAAGEQPPAQWALESFTFTNPDGSPNTMTFIGAPPGTTGDLFVHNPGDGNQTVTDFDPSTDRLVINGESPDTLDVDASGAQLHLPDGSIIQLSLPLDPPPL